MQSKLDHLFGKREHRHILLQLVFATILSACGNNTSHDLPGDRFIDAFYSWDAERLTNLLTATPAAQREKTLYYQAWAVAAHYQIEERRPCEVSDVEIRCSITVRDDFGATLGYMATDTFILTAEEGVITSVNFSGDDPPVFEALFAWIAESQPEVLAGPCLNLFNGGKTPGDCARAVVAAAKVFVAEQP